MCFASEASKPSTGARNYRAQRAQNYRYLNFLRRGFKTFCVPNNFIVKKFGTHEIISHGYKGRNNRKTSFEIQNTCGPKIIGAQKVLCPNWTQMILQNQPNPR